MSGPATVAAVASMAPGPLGHHDTQIKVINKVIISIVKDGTNSGHVLRGV